VDHVSTGRLWADLIDARSRRSLQRTALPHPLAVLGGSVGARRAADLNLAPESTGQTVDSLASTTALVMQHLTTEASSRRTRRGGGKCAAMYTLMHRAGSLSFGASLPPKK
jgi:hypothetical protein